MSNPRAVRISGPLTRHMDGFCAELAEQGYPPESASLQLAHGSCQPLAGCAGLGGAGPDARTVEDFLRARRAAGYRYLLSPRAVVPFIGYLTGLGAVSPSAAVATPGDLLIGDYRRHLVADRGLAPSTVDTYIKVARDALERWGSQMGDLAGLSAADVSALALGECRQRSVPSAKGS